jgi:hypothetical protein
MCIPARVCLHSRISHVQPLSTKVMHRMRVAMRETKDKQYAFRLRPSVYEAGERMAEDQNRSLASILEKLLIDHLRAEGYLPPIEGPGMKRKEGRRR